MLTQADSLPTARTGRDAFEGNGKPSEADIGNGLLAAAAATPPPASGAESMSDPLAALLRTRKRRSGLSRVINIRDIDTDEITLSWTAIPVDDKQIEAANQAATVYVDPTTGRSRAEGVVDQFLYRLHMILLGTAPEDRKRLWENPAILHEFGTLDAVDVIDQTLLPGEKIGVFQVIAEISGFAFRNFAEAIEEAKNS
jgi:hypothetical protein